MSYDEGYGNRQSGRGDDYNRSEGRGGYSRPQDSAEYGGGGRGDDNYYNSSGNFEGGGERRQHGGGRQEGGYDNYNEGGGGERRHQGGRQEGGYGGGGDNESYSDRFGGGSEGRQHEGRHHGGGGGGDSYGVTGGAQYNRPDFNQSGGSGGYGGGDDPSRFSGAMDHANQHAGDSGNGGIFQSALNHLQSNSGRIQNGNIDEQGAVQAHQQLYGGQGGGNQQHSNETMGAGAAMQALKMFTGSGGNQGGGLGGGAGGGQNQFIGMAMAQASKLFDSQSAAGNVAPNANKESVVQQAAEQALKMYMKSGSGGPGPATGGSGGLGGLMSMASKFLS